MPSDSTSRGELLSFGWQIANKLLTNGTMACRESDTCFLHSAHCEFSPTALEIPQLCDLGLSDIYPKDGVTKHRIAHVNV